MSKNLFNKFSISKEGLKLNNKAIETIDPIIKEYLDKGYLPRDIAQVLHEAIFELTTLHNIDCRAK